MPFQLQEMQKARAMRTAARLQESFDYLDNDWLSDYSDLLDRQGDRWVNLLSTPSNRRHGSNYPFFQTETELSLIRQMSRVLCGHSYFAQGMLEGLTSYVVGEGFNYRATAKCPKAEGTAKAVQAYLDHLLTTNLWHEMEQEAFWRSRRDGEVFLRRFDDELRFVEPEQVVQPPDGSFEEWSYGIQTPEDDVVKTLAYYVCYQNDSANGDRVLAKSLYHLKINTDSTVKRGLPDFAFDTREAILQAQKLLGNMAQGAAIQAAIAEVQQFETSTESQIDAFASAQADYQKTDAYTGDVRNYERIQPGSIRRIPKGTTYIAPPFSAGTTGWMEIFQASVRSAGVKWNAPEWLISADASNNNYASSLVAESPFVKRCRREQKRYKQLFLRILTDLVEVRFPGVFQWVELQCETPPVEARDRIKEAQLLQIEHGAGVTSKTTWQQLAGRDSELEAKNFEHEKDDPTPPAGSGGGGAGGVPTDPADAQAGAVQSNDLRATVGGSAAIAALQKDYYAGAMPRAAAIANAVMVFGFTQSEAELLFPEEAPQKMTPEAGGPAGPPPTPDMAEGLTEGCEQNKTGKGFHDSETGHPCSPDTIKDDSLKDVLKTDEPKQEKPKKAPAEKIIDLDQSPFWPKADRLSQQADKLKGKKAGKVKKAGKKAAEQQKSLAAKLGDAAAFTVMLAALATVPVVGLPLVGMALAKGIKSLYGGGDKKKGKSKKAKAKKPAAKTEAVTEAVQPSDLVKEVRQLLAELYRETGERMPDLDDADILAAVEKHGPLAEALTEDGYSGTKKDALGRERCYNDGKQVSCNKGGDKSGKSDDAKADAGKAAAAAASATPAVTPKPPDFKPTQPDPLADADVSKAGPKSRLMYSAHQQYAEASQPLLAAAFGNNHEEVMGNRPMDIVQVEADGKTVRHGVEVKTWLENCQGQTKVKSGAAFKKNAWKDGKLMVPASEYARGGYGKGHKTVNFYDADEGKPMTYHVVPDPTAPKKKSEHRTVHMCVVDERDRWAKKLAGEDAGDRDLTGGRVMYARGAGNVKIGSKARPLVACDSPADWLKLRDLPDDEYQKIAAAHDYGRKSWPSGTAQPDRGQSLNFCKEN